MNTTSSSSWHDECGPDPWQAQIFLNIQTNVDGSPLTLLGNAFQLSSVGLSGSESVRQWSLGLLKVRDVE